MSSLIDRMDQVLALQMGADDYITKPMDRQLTLAKIQTLLRRTYNYIPEEGPTFQFDGLILDSRYLNLIQEDQVLELTATEYQIMVE